jgi:glutamine amidotransferase
MCRHAAWLGAPRALADLIQRPAYGLLTQSYAPREQRHGTVNADGYGMGWYVPGRPAPVRYRRSVPIWADANLPALAETAASHCLLAAVRCATVGMPIEETGTAPFADGRWLLSHNGRLAREAARSLAADAESACDSAWVAAGVFARLRAGALLGDALAEVVVQAGGKDPDARLNLLACDGTTLAATTWGDTLYLHTGAPEGGVLAASEPLDDAPGWQAVPDRSLLIATPGEVQVRPL